MSYPRKDSIIQEEYFKHSSRSGSTNLVAVECETMKNSDFGDTQSNKMKMQEEGSFYSEAVEMRQRSYTN